MVGSMVGSVIAMLGGVGNRVAHGGPIVAVLGAVDQVLMFFVAVIIGVLITAFLVNFLKKDVNIGPELAAANDAPVNDEPEMNEETSSTVQEEPEIKKLTDITNEQLMDIQLQGTTRDEVIGEMIQKLDVNGLLSAKETFKEAIFAREAQSSTGIGANIAIPHGKSSAVKQPAVVFGLHKDGVDWNSLDGTPAKIIFMIAVPEESAGDDHLKILQMLSRKLMDDQFRNDLLEVTTVEQAYELLDTIQ